MKLLYSNILPMAIKEGKETIAEAINSQIQLADRIDIAVGYVSRLALEEIDMLVEKHNIKNICLNLGMYFTEGMPEGSYHTALRINKKWKNLGIGEIRMVKAFKYHGKLYVFYKEGKPVSAIIGSANLGVLKLEANNRRQYEISAITEEKYEVEEIVNHIEELKKSNVSANIAEIEGMPLIYEKNTALSGIELVTEVPKSNVEFYKRCASYASFRLPLKVPSENERYMDDGKHFTKSNVNVCYAAPRNKRKSRDWYETQLTVSKEITRLEGYPEKKVPFYIVTDDGYWFKAHTTSDGNKQFSAVGDELIMGRWLKGRLAAAGLVKPVNDTQADTEREGMITKEMLEEYGCDNLYLKKTGQTALDGDGTPLDVWMLSFKQIEGKGEEE
ncbi:restriction endonuclease PLD domain-containing protein [Eubacterium sp. AF19-12LB]|uniref:restriction endonuclease PLD domain-containing protein n=1 Tax=Eubacterium sp. AF19-12LB TaxID=2293106 RepID=UPI000E557C5A|nr:restriction endonuclease PLD domain-containing protein [Eubacterium sp. AF19-12LB]RHR36954.1 NgoFVII family restriction endonuclease [Eubacterium sp. AF19-12LB]